MNFFTKEGLAATLEQQQPDNNNNNRIYCYIYATIEATVYPLVFSIKNGDGKALWQRLKQKLAPSDPSAIQTLQATIDTITLNDNNLPLFIQKLEELMMTFMTAVADEHEIKCFDRTITTHLLRALPPNTYGAIYADLTKDQYPTFSSAAERLLYFYESYARFHQAGATSTTAPVFAAQQQPPHPPPRPRRGGFNNSNNKRFEGACHFCNKLGHKQADCWNFKTAQTRARGTHSFRSRGGGVHKRPQFRNNHNNNNHNVAAMAITTQNNNNNNNNNIRHNIEDTIIMFVGATDIPQEPNIIAVDSGAAVHLINNRALFKYIRPTKYSILTASSTHSTPASGEGEAVIYINDKYGDPVRIHLERAVYVPGPVSLLSISNLTTAGHTVHFNHNRPSIALSNGRVLPMKISNGLFWLNFNTTPNSTPALFTTTMQPSTGQLQLLHQSLGHASREQMLRMGVINNNTQLPHCEHCRYAKSHKAPSPKKVINPCLNFQFFLKKRDRIIIIVI